jgi:hypothetical protein
MKERQLLLLISLLVLPWDSLAQQRERQAESFAELRARKQREHRQERENRQKHPHQKDGSFDALLKMDLSLPGLIFPKERPGSIITGVVHGVKSLAIGAVLGASSIVGLPLGYLVLGGDDTNWIGVVVSSLAGLLVGVPTVTVFGVHAAYSVAMGTIQTPFTVAATLAGMVWDSEQHQWGYYSLPEDYQAIANYTRSKAPADTTLYNVLGVDAHATPKDIKRAYYTKAKDVHPDKNPDPSAAATFLVLHDAYQILSDAEQRATYDEWGLSSSSSPTSMEGLPVEFDPRTFFVILFGSQQVVEQYTGELGISSMVEAVVQLVKSGVSPETLLKVTNQLQRQPRKRQVELAMNLIQRCQSYSRWSSKKSKQAFRELAQREAQQILETPFGTEFLQAIGRSLLLEANLYLGGLDLGLAARGRKKKRQVHHVVQVLFNMKNLGVQFNQLANATDYGRNNPSGEIVISEEDMEQLLPDMLELAWSFNALDIASALGGACFRLFADTSVSRSERKRRAQAVKILGQEFLKALPNQNTSLVVKEKDAKEMAARVGVAVHAARRKVRRST